jgi:hypothetical protein
VRVAGVEAPHAGEVPVELSGVAGCREPRRPGVDAGDEDGRMRFARRAEVILYTEMKLDAVPAEPAAAARREHRRLLDLVEPEHPRVEAARDILGTRRAGQLDVMEHRAAPPQHVLTSR